MGNKYVGVSWPEPVRRVASAWSDFFFPWGTYCVCCGNFIDEKRAYCLCDHCVGKIGWGNIEIKKDTLLERHEEGLDIGLPAECFREWPLDSIRSCMKYGIYERRLIFELKYNGNRYMARILAKIILDRLMADTNGAEVLCGDYLVPVPMNKEKERLRGFNQTEKIAEYLANYIGIPVMTKAIIRTKNTTAQRSVAGSQRFANLNEAFCPSPDLADKVAGKRLILLDDVFTTGSTAYYCGRLLKEAGAARVDLITIATGNGAAEGFYS